MSTNLYDYNSEIEKLLTNTNIISYFTSNNKSIYEFVKTYIEIDKLLGDTSFNSNFVYNKLDEIKNVIINNSTQISNLSSNLNNSNSNIISLIQSKLDNISSITNNELKCMFIDLQKQFSQGSNTNELKNVFDSFKERLEILNSQKLNDIDRKNLDILSNIQTNFEKLLDSHPISNNIDHIKSTLSSINENFSNNSAKKGQVAETVLFNILSETFPDTEILDTSHIPNSGDLQMIKDNKPTILIDSKNFGNKTVPKRDLDKFYSDIQQNNCSGILCNTFGGIANKQHFEIDIVDKNILVFIHSHQFDASIFKLATNIIYNMHQELKDKQTDSISIDQRLYQNLKIEYNYYIQSFRHHLDIIKSNVNSLSQLSFTLLDNFFKRKATNIELKKFSCHICSAQLSTEKILKTHLKKIHADYGPSKTTPNESNQTNSPPLLSIYSIPKTKTTRKKKNNSLENCADASATENIDLEKYNYPIPSRLSDSDSNKSNKSDN